MSRKKLEDRLAEAERLLAEGHSPTAAAREVAQKYAVGLRQGQKYVARVFKRWQEEDREMRQHRRNLVRLSAQHLYRECFEREKWGVCVRVLTLLCKIDGLFDPELRVAHRRTAGRDVSMMTSHEKRRALNKLLQKAMQNSPSLAQTTREALAEIDGN